MDQLDELAYRLLRNKMLQIPNQADYPKSNIIPPMIYDETLGMYTMTAYFVDPGKSIKFNLLLRIPLIVGQSWLSANLGFGSVHVCVCVPHK